MNKTDFVNQLAGKLEITKKQAGEIYDTTFGVDAENLGIIAEALKAGEKVHFVGFGNFEVSDTSARKGRNPQNGEEIEIAAGKRAKFSAGKGLKEAIK